MTVYSITIHAAVHLTDKTGTPVKIVGYTKRIDQPKHVVTDSVIPYPIYTPHPVVPIGSKIAIDPIKGGLEVVDILVEFDQTSVHDYASHLHYVLESIEVRSGDDMTEFMADFTKHGWVSENIKLQS